MSNKNRANNPWFAAGTACVGAAAGLVGSIYSKEIAMAPPFTWLNIVQPTDLDGYGKYAPAVLFLFFIILFGWLFAKGYGAQLKAQSHVTEQLKTNVDNVSSRLGNQMGALDKSVADVGKAFEVQLNKLSESIRSLPPDGYLTEFEEQFSTALAHSSAAFLSKDAIQDRATVNTAIVVNLVAILSLALAYDSPPKGVRYGVTLMVFRRLAPGMDDDQLRKRFILSEPNLAAATLCGYLELLPEFSLEAVLGDIASPIENVSPICLPVPHPHYLLDGGKSTILPGAPKAFITRETQYFEDSGKLAEVIEATTALRASVAQQARQYFSEHALGSQIKSFISVPFGFPSLDGGDVEPIGVINVHSTAPAMLAEKRAELYAPLTVPMRMLLAVLLQQYSALPDEKTAQVATPGTL